MPHHFKWNKKERVDGGKLIKIEQLNFNGRIGAKQGHRGEKVAQCVLRKISDSRGVVDLISFLPFGQL